MLSRLLNYMLFSSHPSTPSSEDKKDVVPTKKKALGRSSKSKNKVSIPARGISLGATMHNRLLHMLLFSNCLSTPSFADKKDAILRKKKASVSTKEISLQATKCSRLLHYPSNPSSAGKKDVVPTKKKASVPTRGISLHAINRPSTPSSANKKDATPTKKNTLAPSSELKKKASVPAREITPQATKHSGRLQKWLSNRAEKAAQKKFTAHREKRVSALCDLLPVDRATAYEVLEKTLPAPGFNVIHAIERLRAQMPHRISSKLARLAMFCYLTGLPKVEAKKYVEDQGTVRKMLRAALRKKDITYKSYKTAIYSLHMLIDPSELENTVERFEKRKKIKKRYEIKTILYKKIKKIFETKTEKHDYKNIIFEDILDDAHGRGLVPNPNIARLRKWREMTRDDADIVLNVGATENNARTEYLIMSMDRRVWFIDPHEPHKAQRYVRNTVGYIDCDKYLVD